MISLPKFLASCVVVVILSLTAYSMAVAEDNNGLSPAQKEEVNAAIKEFLSKNPEVIMQALQDHQRNQQQAQMQQAGTIAEKSIADSTQHVYGNPDAPVTLVEFADFQCPYCKQFYSTAKQLVDESNGQVNWIYRHLPLPMHGNANTMAAGSECAADQGGNDAFWKFLDGIFTDALPNQGNADDMKDIAKKVGLDEGKFQECLSSDKTKDKIQKDSDDARTAGISGTPGNVLYNKTTKKSSAVPGALPVDSLRSEIQKLQ